MTPFGIIVLVFVSVTFALFVMAAGVWFGAGIILSKRYKHAEPPMFVRRLPGDVAPYPDTEKGGAK